MQQPLFKRFDVWRRLSPERALRYNCIQNVETGLLRVCTADFVAPAGALDRDQARYFVERILEWDPNDPEQPEWFNSVEAAIAARDADFAD
jgi:hypothetical protein